MNKQIIHMSKEELVVYREDIVKTYIGESTKPFWYYNKLKEIDIILNTNGNVT